MRSWTMIARDREKSWFGVIWQGFRWLSYTTNILLQAFFDRGFNRSSLFLDSKINVSLAVWNFNNQF